MKGTGHGDLPQAAAALTADPRQRAVTWRSVALGLAGTIFICGLTPYNDYALNNTFLVGNNMPISVVMVMFLFALLINGPLSRFAPRWALGSGEMAVGFAMMLVSCALPSSGLMRYFPPSLVSPLWHAKGNEEYARLLDSLNLPQWIFPSFSGQGMRQWIRDPIVTGYMERWTEEDQPIPYRAWIMPAATWGVFLFALYGALLCMSSIVRRQWMENERLLFPLAQIQLALVAQPRERRFLNDFFRHRPFWIAFMCIFLLHSWNALANYSPHVPQIGVSYNLWDVFRERPWSYMDSKVKDAVVFFTVVGVTYYLSSSVAFSLWAFYILEQFRRLYLGVMTDDPNIQGRSDEHYGALFAFFLTILWVGRRHWWLVIKQAFRGARDGEEHGRYLPYPVAFWGFVFCGAVMVGWLLLAGATWAGAVVSVVVLLIGFLLITRIIAETGLVHGQIFNAIYKPWTLLSIYGYPHAVPDKTFYLSALIHGVHYDYRETVPVYATHGMKVADQTIFASRGDAEDGPRERRMGRKIIGCLLLALLVGYGVSLFSTLWTEYHFAWTKDTSAQVPNDWGAVRNPRDQILGATLTYSQNRYFLRHDPLSHMGGGFAFTALLAFLRLRFSWWPLHPIGFVMLGSFPAAHLWFSIFWGWLAKVLIVRFGGAKMYQGAKPFFLGLIVGESMAAAFWLVMGIVLSAAGATYYRVSIMPG